MVLRFYEQQLGFFHLQILLGVIAVRILSQPTSLNKTLGRKAPEFTEGPIFGLIVFSKGEASCSWSSKALKMLHILLLQIKRSKILVVLLPRPLPVAKRLKSEREPSKCKNI